MKLIYYRLPSFTFSTSRCIKKNLLKTFFLLMTNSNKVEYSSVHNEKKTYINYKKVFRLTTIIIKDK